MIIKKYILGMYQTNCYLIADEISKECAVIDPGAICVSLDKEISTNNYDVKYIIFTHGHFDHIGGLEYYMDKYPQAIVLMHKNDISSILNNIDVFYFDSENKENIVKQITLQNDNDIFMLGDNKLKIIHTPGHSKGSVCIYVDSILFSGDTLFQHSIGRTDLIDSDFSELKTSVISKLYTLHGDIVVYPGHGNATTIKEEKYGNPYVRV